MLKGIPKVLSPQLVQVLMEMGHGDEIVLGDGNFPASSLGPTVVRADGHGVPEILSAILQLMPLDPYVACPVALMQVTPGDPVETPIWETYRSLLEADPKGGCIEEVERFAFYERARQAYAIVATSETALYANIILKKGVVTE